MKLWLAIAIACTVLHAQRYEKFTLDSQPGEDGQAFDNVLVRDVNGDGSQDIVIQTDFRLVVFYQNGGKFNLNWKNPDASFMLPANAFLYTFGKVGTRVVPLSMTDDGIMYPGEDGKDKPLIVYPTVFETRGQRFSAPSEYAFVLEGKDEARIAVLPSKSEFVLFRIDGLKSPTVESVVPFSLLTRGTLTPFFPSVSQQTFVPDLRMADVTGDGEEDIVVTTVDSTIVYQKNGNGFLPGREISFSGKKKEPRYFNINIKPLWVDIDGDGIPDIAIPQASKGILDIYLQKKPGVIPSSPDTQITLDESYIGKMEYIPKLKMMILYTVKKFGIGDIIKAFSDRKVTLILKGYVFSEGQFKSKWESEWDIPFTAYLTRREGSFNAESVPRIDTDFTGDGIPDVLMVSRSEKKGVVYRLNSEGLSREPAMEFPISPLESSTDDRGIVADINGDGVPDVLMNYRDKINNKGRIEITLIKRR